MTNPFEHITNTLCRGARWSLDAITETPEQLPGKKEQIRALLRYHGPATAVELAKLFDFPNTGRVSALLKADVARGSIFRRGHSYHWNPQFDADLQQRLQAAATLLRANGFSVSKGI